MAEKIVRAGWLIALLFMISFGAAGAVPVRLIEAVKAADKAAIRELLRDGAPLGSSRE